MHLVKKHLEKFTEWKVDDNELYYYGPDLKNLIDHEHPWKKVVKP